MIVKKTRKIEVRLEFSIVVQEPVQRVRNQAYKHQEMPEHNASSRAARRNTQGGKAFKSQKKEENFRTKAAREEADELVELFQKQQMATRNPHDAKKQLTASEGEALEWMRVGRVVRRFGNARYEVLCNDDKLRQCVLRGLLRRKNKVNVQVDSMVVVSLRASDTELMREAGGSSSDIIGLCNEWHIAELNKLPISKRVFPGYSGDAVLDDIFDRSGAAAGGDGESDEEAEVDIDAL